jgi:hypothetical protein
MFIEIEGVKYLPAAAVAKQVRVSRTTLWRWRQEGKVPVGHRYRDRMILFTGDEFLAIRQYANRLEVASPNGARTLRVSNVRGGDES